MKKCAIFLPAFLLIALSFNSPDNSAPSKDQSPVLKWEDKTGAKRIPKGKKIYNVALYGAKNDGMTLNTKAIQAAIDACSAKRGGVVTFDTGAYVTGSIFIKKGVTLLVSKDTRILGSQDIADYPEIDTRSPGDISFAKGWRFKNVSIKTTTNGELRIQNSTEMDIKLSGSGK